jgi:hypothetical protein
MPASPRRVLALFTAAVTTLLLAAPAAQAELAQPAENFVQSIGVNTHVIYDSTSYGRFDLVRSRLKELGVSHIRDGICATCAWQHDRLRTLAADGIRSNLLIGKPTDSAATFSANIAAVKKLGSVVDAVEGANEWDLFSGRSPSWVSQDRAHQQRLWNAVQADPALRALPVIGPSLVFWWESPSSWDKLGDVSPWMTFGNSHGYPGGRPPEATVGAEITRARKVSGTKPIYMTEAGYHNALKQANQDHPAVSEAVAATYMPRLFLENFRSGVRRTYAYELLDELAGRAAVDQEQSFGLVRADYSPKPAFTALQNLIALLSDKGTPIAGADVSLTVTTTAGDLRRLVLRKRDGSVHVVLWRAGSVWNERTRTPLTVPSANVTVRFNQGATSVTAYRPVSSRSGTALGVQSGAVTVPVGADPVVLHKR